MPQDLDEARLEGPYAGKPIPAPHHWPYAHRTLAEVDAGVVLPLGDNDNVPETADLIAHRCVAFAQKCGRAEAVAQVVLLALGGLVAATMVLPALGRVFG